MKWFNPEEVEGRENPISASAFIKPGRGVYIPEESGLWEISSVDTEKEIAYIKKEVEGEFIRKEVSFNTIIEHNDVPHLPKIEHEPKGGDWYEEEDEEENKQAA